MQIQNPYMQIKYFAYSIYGQFGGHICYWHIFGSYMLTKSCSCCILAKYICENFGSVCSFKMFVLCAIFEMWQPYLFSDMWCMCVVLLVEWLLPFTSYVVYICSYIPPYMHVKYLVYMIYMPSLVGIFVSGTYMMITFYIEVAVGYILIWTCQYFGPVSHVA